MSGTVNNSIGRQVFQLGYQASPIILSGNSLVTQLMPSGLLPIIALTQGISFVQGLLHQTTPTDLNKFFANFSPLPGATLIENEVGTYPFANQAIAANAIIAQPRHVSLKMDCPVQAPGTYLTKLATLTALRATLDLHSTSGGTYIVATPGQIYPNCLLTRIADITSGAGHQVQVTWQFDFMQPLLTFSQAEGAQNTLMGQLTGGLFTDGGWSGILASAGEQLSGALSSLVPAAQSIIGGAIPIAGQGAPLLPVTQVPI